MYLQLSFYLSIFPPKSLSFYLSIRLLSICISIYLSFYLSILLFFFLSLYLFFCLISQMSFYLSRYLYKHINPISSKITPPCSFLSINLSIFISFYQFISLFIYLSIFQYIDLTLDFQVFSISQYVYFLSLHFYLHLSIYPVSIFLIYQIKMRKVTII